MKDEIEIPKNHPRAESLRVRERLINCFESGAVARAGLIAQGRGEAFDYLIGEKTLKSATIALRAAAATILLAKNPVISVNGNVAALVPEDIVNLAKITQMRIEVNLFYRFKGRDESIKKILEDAGAKEILGIGEAASATIPELLSERRRVDPRGILIADVVLVPLEDGDRTEALRRMGKNVIAIDLNPLSRTAQLASITIVDNVLRALPLLIKESKDLKRLSSERLQKIVAEYDNIKILKEAINSIRFRLEKLAEVGLIKDLEVSE